MEEEEKKDNTDNKLKQDAKTKPKKKNRKKIVIKIIPLIATFLIAFMVASCFIALVNIVKETAQDVINSIVDFFKGSQTAIEIDDEQLDKLIEIIEATGIDLEDLELLRRN